MNGLSTSTIIQTTWRSPFTLLAQHNVGIAYQSTLGSKVSFVLNAHTGIIQDIQGFDPKGQIPNWYSETPFTEWSINIDSSHRIELFGDQVLCYRWESNEPTLTKFLEVFSAQNICAIWIGKFGYSILESEPRKPRPRQLKS